MGSSLRNKTTQQCYNCNRKNNATYALKGKYAQSKSDLYVFKTGPYFKIGSTDNIQQRIKLLQCNCPYPIEIIYHGVGEGKDEEFWHKVLKHRHHSGEWFRGDL